MKKLLITMLWLPLLACEEAPPAAVGLLESDRLELITESSEPIIAINVTEGQRVEQGTLLLDQDKSRVSARKTDARAQIARLEALLAEQIAGPRQEVIEAAEASVEAARVAVDINQLELERLQRHVTRG
jgi:HlyD family secretion protein